MQKSFDRHRIVVIKADVPDFMRMSRDAEAQEGIVVHALASQCVIRRQQLRLASDPRDSVKVEAAHPRKIHFQNPVQGCGAWIHDFDAGPDAGGRVGKVFDGRGREAERLRQVRERVDRAIRILLRAGIRTRGAH